MIKKQSVGIWFNIIVAVLTIVSVIVYGVNISGDGYFQNASVGNLVAYCVIAVIMLVAVIVLAQPKFTGTAALVTEIISGLLKIAIPVLLMLCLVNLISARAEGLGFIYFSPLLFDFSINPIKLSIFIPLHNQTNILFVIAYLINHFLYLYHL